jgi:hypothetical protein
MAFFLISLFVGRSVVPIENILVLQFAYFCIAAQTKVELAFTSLAFYGRFSTGYNINIVESSYKDTVNYLACKVMTTIYQ